MSAKDDDVDEDTIDALRALAKLEGKTPRELLSEKLRERTGTKLSKRRDDETPEEAKERWIEEERNDPDGFFSGGGATGGGIFGDGPIAFEGFDPGARSRGAQRESHARQVRLVDALERLVDRVEGGGTRQISGSEPRQLPSRRR